MKTVLVRSFDRETKDRRFTGVILLEEQAPPQPFIVTALRRWLPQDASVVGEIKATHYFFDSPQDADKSITQHEKSFLEDGFQERSK
jgi:hypothetical protein